MLANSLADVVAEEAAKRLLPDLNLERKAKWAERVGVWGGKTIGFGASGHLGQEKRSWRYLRTRPSVGGRSNMHADCFQHAGGRVGPPKPFICTSQQRSAMQSLQCVQSYKQFDFGAVTLVCHGQTPPRSSPNSKTRKDSSSIRQQEIRVTFSTNLAYATKRTVNMTRKNSVIALRWVIGTSSAHTVTRNITLCLLLLSLNLISHTLINVVITPFLKLPSRVAKVIMF